MKYIFIAAILISYTLTKGITGGKYNPDPSDQGLAKATAYARSNFKTACNLPDYNWNSVISTQAQVVRGNNYFITAKVTKGSESKTIVVTVWVQPLENNEKTANISITNCKVK